MGTTLLMFPSCKDLAFVLQCVHPVFVYLEIHSERFVQISFIATVDYIRNKKKTKIKEDSRSLF